MTVKNHAAKSTSFPRGVGFVLSSESWTVAQLVDQAVAAENAGFDILWTSDHFHPWQDNQGHSGHAWVLLAAVGQRTSHIPYGTGVTCPSYRHRPAIVAQAFASLGILNPGRVFLGVGAGEALNEEASGNGWDEHEQRAERLAEAIQLIKQLWTGEWVHFVGEHYQIPRARLFDIPEKPIPLYVAASGENSIELAGKYGDGWITEPKNALDPKTRKDWEKSVRESGRDPSTMPIISELFVFVGRKDDPELKKVANEWRFLPNAWTDFVDNPDPEDIRKQAEKIVPLDKVIENWLVSDDPQAYIDRLVELFRGGVTQVFIHSAQSDQQKVIDFFGQRVLPKVHEQLGIQAHASAR